MKGGIVNASLFLAFQVYYKMYEKDKVRYEKEMKQYAKDKPPKEATKLLKTKKQKTKKSTASKTIEHSKSHSSPEPPSAQIPRAAESALVTSPSSFNLLNNLPFGSLPSPMLEIGGENDEDSFTNFDYNTV